MTGVLESVTALLARPRQVLVYDRSDEEQARAILMVVAERVAEDVVLSDPSLSNLVIVDGQRDPEWDEFLPTVPVLSVTDVTSGREPVTQASCVISLSPDFLRRKSTRTLATRATRFYGMTAQPQFATEDPIFLQGAA